MVEEFPITSGIRVGPGLNSTSVAKISRSELRERMVLFEHLFMDFSCKYYMSLMELQQKSDFDKRQSDFISLNDFPGSWTLLGNLGLKLTKTSDTAWISIAVSWCRQQKLTKELEKFCKTKRKFQLEVDEPRKTLTFTHLFGGKQLLPCDGELLWWYQ